MPNSGAQLDQDLAPEQAIRPRRQPRYYVVLWDDDDHTYGYVERMMKELFQFDESRSFEIAKTVDHDGRAICLTTTLEHAELKRDQIKSAGPDFHVEQNVNFPLVVRIEPLPV